MISASSQEVRLTEIFYSLQGEGLFSGQPTTFIRLTGCPLRCAYCDTAYAFTGGKKHSIENVIDQVDLNPSKYVCVTGGEPLAQPNVHHLMKVLCDKDYKVSLETSGALDVSNVDPRVIKVLDIKTPDSGEVDKNLISNIKYLLPHDVVKFVICSENDYLWAKSFMSDYLNESMVIYFSPVVPGMDLAFLADRILSDQLQVRLQIQLHKHLWGDARGK
jgi:7-carboxy-7-deazaguanine synthase